MRITFGMQTDETLLNLNDQQERITNLSQEISSGKTLESPSDDPYAWSQAMNVNQTIREYNSFISGVNFATGWGQYTESSLNQLSDLLSQAKQVAITAASSTTASSQSAALETQVNGILNEALGIANTQYEGQYIFAGVYTETKPYSMTGGASTYSGSKSAIEVKTSTSALSGGGMTAVGVTGDQVFGSSTGTNVDVLGAIYNLAQEIKNGDSTGITNSITTIGDAFNQVNNQLSSIGVQLSTLSNQKTALSTMVTNQQSTLSNLQDTDLASAATKLSQAQTAYQAALQVTSLLDNLNLASILSGSSVS